MHILCLQLPLLLLLIASNGYAEYKTEKYIAQQGELALQAINFSEAQPIALDGEWAFYWQQTIAPNVEENIQPDTFINIPGLWNKGAITEHRYDRFGYASLKLNITLPLDTQHYLLRIPSLPSAYTLWANGKLVAQNGTFATNKQDEQAWTSPKVVPLYIAEGKVQLVFHISNFHHKEGGIWRSLVLTTPDNLFSLRLRPVIADALLFSILFFTGLYYIAFFIIRRSELPALFFGLFCIAIASRSILVGERIFYELASSLPWSLLQRAEHQLFFIFAPLFFWFFYHLYPHQVGRKLPWFCTIVCTVPIVSTWVMPLSSYAEFLFPFQLFLSGLTLIISLILIKLLLNKQKDAVYFSLSFLILFLFSLHDILLSNFIITGRPIVQYGVVAFIISQSLLLQKRYAGSLSLVQTMAEELQSRNNELVKVDQVKDEFLAYTSHELRTPIHGIIGLTGTLLKDKRHPLSQGQNHQLTLIESSAKRLGNLVNDILDFSKLKNQELSIKLIRVNLSAILDLTIKVLDPLIDHSKLAFKLDIPYSLPPVLADENRLQQILFNLLGNAIKYTEQGSITIAVSVHDHSVKLSITDTGPGISDDQREILFEPFKQLGNREYNIEGTGLGLGICQKLLELHNSELNIHSKVDEGTCAQFSLAIASDELIDHDVQLPVHQARSTNLIPSDNAFTVLIVDDEEVNRQVITNQLQLEGYQVLVAHCGQEALNLLNKTTPNLILLDLMMPKMNGFEVCSIIRKQYNRFQLPILMLTASHQVNDVVEAINLGANDYLYKPYQDIELLARVHNLISASEAQKKSAENHSLKIEIKRRKASQKKLQQTNYRLSNILNNADKGILLLDKDLNLVYCNDTAEKLLSLDIPVFTGLNIDKIFSSHFKQALASISIKELLSSKQSLVTHLNNNAGQAQDFDVLVSAFELKKEHYINLFIQAKKVEPISEALRTSDNKITDLEKAILEVVSHDSIAQPKNSRSDLVHTLRLSIDLWEKYSHKGKVELAEESGIWRTYLDGSTVKTRTLDKYLSIKSLPKKPRWRSVVRTANFIKGYCTLTPEEDEQLTQATQKIEHEFLEIDAEN